MKYIFMFKNISNFANTSDYLPILNGAIITDMIVLLLTSLGYIQSKSLHSWYHKYGLASILADVLSIVIVLIITRFVYSAFFDEFAIYQFVGLAVLVQFIHDLSFAYFFQSIPRGKSQILDTFKDYANELGTTILLADASMIISTSLLAGVLAQLDMNNNIVLLIVLSYMVPYFLYSI